jgi:hypothetical protein
MPLPFHPERAIRLPSLSDAKADEKDNVDVSLMIFTIFTLKKCQTLLAFDIRILSVCVV